MRNYMHGTYSYLFLFSSSHGYASNTLLPHFHFQWWERQYSPTYLITIYKILRSIYIQIRPAVDEKKICSSRTAFNNLQRNENPRNSRYCFTLVKISNLSITKTAKKFTSALQPDLYHQNIN